MVSAVATVVAGGLGFAASKSASKKAERGQEKALAATTEGTAQARGDVSRGFDLAKTARGKGFENVLNLLSGAPAQQIAPFQQGNVAAQQQIGRGLTQQQNALLGLPTDLSGFQARQIGQPSDFNIDLSRFRPQPAPQTGGFQLSPDVLAQIQQSIGQIPFGGTRPSNFNFQSSR